MTLHRALALTAAALVAACSQPNATMQIPAVAAQSQSGPPPCKGQHTTKKYGGLNVKLKTKGGAFCVPAFGGFGGKIAYPGVDRTTPLTLRTSTSNIYNEPALGSGAPIVYLNLHFHAGTHFGSNLPSIGGLTSSQITSGDPYTAYGIVAVGHLVLMFPPCWATATSGTYGGVIPNIGEIFTDTTVTGAGYGVIEIYPGEQVTTQC